MTYYNTNLHQHENEIFSKINAENGGTIQSIQIKLSANLSATRNKLTINADVSSFSSDSDIVLSKFNGYTLIPS